MSRQTGLSVRVGELSAGVVDDGAVVAGSPTRWSWRVEVAWLGCAATAGSWADRRGGPGAWPRPPAACPPAGPSPHQATETRNMVLLGIDPHQDTRTVGHGELVGWARTPWPERRRGRWRTAARSRAGWNQTCWPPGTGPGGAAAAAGRRPPGRPGPGHVRPDPRPPRPPAPPCANPPSRSPGTTSLLGAQAARRHREHLVAEPTRTITRRRWHRHQLDPGPGPQHPPAARPGPWSQHRPARPDRRRPRLGGPGQARPAPVAASGPAATRSASWTITSTNASPSSPHPAQPARRGH